MTDRPGYRKVGSVGRPHGIRGRFHLNLESDFPDWVAEQSKLYAFKDDEAQPWTLLSSSVNGDRVLCTVDTLRDRTAVEAARGVELYVTEDAARDLVNDDPDFFYNSDLVGLKMINHETDKALGHVKQVVEMPAQNLLEIERGAGETFLIPFVKPLLPLIDIEQGLIRAIIPDGLIDIDEKE